VIYHSTLQCNLKYYQQRLLTYEQFQYHDVHEAASQCCS
jgi:hypothetical protein